MKIFVLISVIYGGDLQPLPKFNGMYETRIMCDLAAHELIVNHYNHNDEDMAHIEITTICQEVK